MAVADTLYALCAFIKPVGVVAAVEAEALADQAILAEIAKNAHDVKSSFHHASRVRRTAVEKQTDQSLIVPMSPKIANIASFESKRRMPHLLPSECMLQGDRVQIGAGGGQGSTEEPGADP